MIWGQATTEEWVHVLSSTIASLSGLAAGIAFLVVFAIVGPNLPGSPLTSNSGFQSNNYVGTYPWTSISADRLRENYTANEAIDFTLNVHGYGTVCDFAPTISIISNSNDSVVWSYIPVFFMSCHNDPDSVFPHTLNDTWSTGQSTETTPIIAHPGNYTMKVQYYGETLKKPIRVFPPPEPDGVKVTLVFP